MKNDTVFRLLAMILLSFCLLSNARADIASDVQAGKLSLQQIASNALLELSPTEVVTRMIAAGVNPILAAEAVAQSSPAAAAPSIAAAAAVAVPDAAADIAATVARLRPELAVEIAVATAAAAPTFKQEIADRVAGAVPGSAADVYAALFPSGAGGGGPAGAPLQPAAGGPVQGAAGGGGSGMPACNATTVGTTYSTATGIYETVLPPPADITNETCSGADIQTRKQTFRNRRQIIYNYRCQLIGGYLWQREANSYGPTEQVPVSDVTTITACPAPTACAGSPAACVCPNPNSRYVPGQGCI
jgi:hypothetical protein